MIKAYNLTKEYDGQLVVDHISFEVPQGKTLVFLGTSGSGKTTTLKMINRLIAPSSGSIMIDGVDISEESPEKLRRNIGYVIQHIGLFPHMNIRQNVSVVPRMLNWDAERISERVVFLLDLVGLQKIDPNTYPDKLSGGQQQRVGLARALAADPDIILMDEPFGSLDPITRSEIRSEFRNLEEIIHKTIVLVTHDVVEAWELADIVYILDQGKVQQSGSPRDLIWNPTNSFISDFLRPHKLQLEMMTLQVGEVMPFSKEKFEIDPDFSVYHAIQEKDKQQEKAKVNMLQQAFINYKSSNS